MGESIFHLSVPIREALTVDDATLRFFFRVDGEDMSGIRTDLVIRQARGHMMYPVGACSNFDPATGCLGHSRDEMQGA